ncbi:MAG: glycosyltransferase, partial [Candidatus Atribacteria bacterium]|nr:glycosyltransferase [Candidatus Atribacteria bacterium]
MEKICPEINRAMENTLKNLKVAIVHDFLTTIGGAERVTQMLAEMFPQAPIYTLLYHPRVDKLFPKKKIIVSSLQYWHQTMKIPTKYLFSFMPQAIESFDFGDYDLVISSNNSFAGGIITNPKTYHLSYCHSPTRYLWDASHTYLDEQKLPGFIKNIIRAKLSDLRIWDRLSANRVQKYIANSQHVRRRIRKYYRREAEVIYPPVDTHLIKPKRGNAGYFIVISRLVSYKKIDLAIDACNLLKLPLIIIGEGEQKEAWEKLAGPTIEFLGWQSDKNKIEYLRNARALIFPGEEDFGIVPVEAMAAGKPVIAFNKGGLKESVTQDKTGI